MGMLVTMSLPVYTPSYVVSASPTRYCGYFCLCISVVYA